MKRLQLLLSLLALTLPFSLSAEDLADLGKWRGSTGDWEMAGDTTLHPDDERRLAWKEGHGVIVNGPTGRTSNILTQLEHGDAEVTLDFMVPKGSNSGVYMMGRYEVQVFDSHGKDKVAHSDAGGIYRGGSHPGSPPKVNASKAPGQWQTYHIVFQAPRFDEAGNKTANAKFVKVLHNGKLVQENVEIPAPTTSPAFNDEKAFGPLMLQGDHGPVAYRNIRIVHTGERPSDPFKDLLSYRMGDSRKPFSVIFEEAQGASPKRLAQIEEGLLKALETPEATQDAKQMILRLLADFGTERSVPVVEKLLLAPELSHYARLVLEPMESPHVDAALARAMERADGKVKVGLVNSMGRRGRANYTPLIAPLLNAEDKDLQRAAVLALGKIPGKQAADALVEAELPDNLNNLRYDSILRIADALRETGNADAARGYYRSLAEGNRPSFIRLAATRGLILSDKDNAVPRIVELLNDKDPALRQLAAKLISSIPGKEATRALVEQAGSAPAETQVMIISALGARGDKSATGAVQRLAANGNEAVRMAAVKALATLGTADSVKPLSRIAAEDSPLGRAATTSLRNLSGDGIDAKMVTLLKDANPAEAEALIDALVARGATVAVPALLKLAETDNADLRRDAYNALADLARAEHMEALVELIDSAPEDRDRRAAQRALAGAAMRVQDAGARGDALAKAAKATDGETKAAIFMVIGRFGDENALPAVISGLDAENEAVSEAAVRALADWPTAAGLEKLLMVARDSDNRRHALLALRGALGKIVGADISDVEREAAFRIALEVAARDSINQAQAAMNALANWSSPKAIELIEEATNLEAYKPLAEGAKNRVLGLLRDAHLLENEVTLSGLDAKIQGDGATYEPADNRRGIGSWRNEETWVSWPVYATQPGKYQVSVSQSMADTPGAKFDIVVGGEKTSGEIKSTGDWARYETFEVGTVEIFEPGLVEVEFRPKTKPGNFVGNLRSVILKKVD